ncbi:hypothetical protein [Pseudodesulfovibrio pelocollis]|uniref:hypothetical protein n=1 Tax=Pseudodesulfovibrio pelocollis TaxID=3051432 RepID=UPI00255B1D26|nr:hypothetical protein [Pseudodesulfovibrio sp. SB368]
MNKLLIPLLLVAHYLFLFNTNVFPNLDAYQSTNALICFMISTMVYGVSFFAVGRATFVLAFWYYVAVFNLLSYLEMIQPGIPFMIVSALVVALVLGITNTMRQQRSMPLPQTPLQRICLAMWILVLGLTAFSVFAWAKWSAVDSLRFAVPGSLIFVLTPAMRTVHKWLTPVQLYLLSCIAINLGLPNLTQFDIFNTTTSLAFFVTVAAFCTLGWAYVRFFMEKRAQRATARPSGPGEEPRA